MNMQLGLNLQEKRKPFEAMVRAARHCDLCERMCGRPKVLSEANGNLDAKILFVAEAPGRLGADRTLIPLYGDRTGDNFQSLIDLIGWKRGSVFITNSILCNPRSEDGNNASPTKHEIENCSQLLRLTIEIVNPEVVVALGATALKALAFIAPHNYTLKEDVRKLVNWNKRKLFVAYHPGPRAVLHRSVVNQRADFYELAKWVDSEKGLKHRASAKKYKQGRISPPLRKLCEVLRFMLGRMGTTSRFKLTKLLFLAELKTSESCGSPLSNLTYLRAVDGPWMPDLQKAIEILTKEGELSVKRRGKIEYFSPKLTEDNEPKLTEQEVLSLIDTIDQYGALSPSRIKTIVYLTEPMKKILKLEKQGKNMHNKPIHFS